MLGLFGNKAVVRRTRKKAVFKKYKQYHYQFYGRQLLVQGYERQGLDYLVAAGFKPDDILTETEFGDGLRIRYTYRKRVRTYMPDIFIRNENIIVEVKSVVTMGLKGRKKRGWSMNQAKAIACHKRGFKFCVLLMTGSGKRIPLPKNWAYMKKDECLRQMREDLGVSI
jgi:hypothetical protein